MLSLDQSGDSRMIAPVILISDSCNSGPIIWLNWFLSGLYIFAQELASLA